MAEQMETLSVSLGERSYPIFVGKNLLGQRELITPHLASPQVCIVTNDVVAPLYLNKLKSILADFQVQVVILPDGEKYKTLETVSQIYDSLLTQNFSRSSTLIALGGGVIGDMTGFAAATYQRGINYIQVPTTLLAQVDSSVGGKTGVNRPMGKNMVGAFYQPKCVLADIATLETLADRELKAGLAEVIKYGLINNVEFYAWLEQNLSSLLARDADALKHAILVSCTEKAKIVASDEREEGIRAILNLGHTFGHAIETATGYSEWLHGEAVATGMVMASDLSWRLGLLTKDEAGKIKNLIAAAGLPVSPPDIGVQTFLGLMGKDKKAEQGKIKFILLEAIGKARVQANIPPDLLNATLAAGPDLTR